MRRIARGERASLPPGLEVHLVASRYGQTPAQVRSWSADDFRTAVAMLPLTSLRSVPSRD